MRRTNFDELPQFINVFKGDMSTVGPRPEIPEIVKLYTREQKEIINFKPGFTSSATVSFLNEEKRLSGHNIFEFYTKQILPQKIICDLEYFSKRSNFFSDILMILKTVGGTFNV